MPVASELAFVVPGACVTKARPRLASRGHTYTPPKTKAYERTVKVYALRALTTRALGKKARRWSKSGRYELSVRVFWSDARRRDLDNALKSIADALNGLAYDDDSQIDVMHVEGAIDREAPRVEVTVRAIAERAA